MLPQDCHGVTWAYAKAAQSLGATVVQHTKVERLTQLPDGAGWEVVTNHGTCTAEHVVNAGGLWAREVGAMAGVHLPLLPMAHHYLITEPYAEEAKRAEVQFTVDLDGGSYMRSERGGVLLGVYEQDCQPWSADATPWEYGENELLPPDLDRIEPELLRAYARYPALDDLGISSIINGAACAPAAPAAGDRVPICSVLCAIRRPAD